MHQPAGDPETVRPSRLHSRRLVAVCAVLLVVAVGVPLAVWLNDGGGHGRPAANGRAPGNAYQPGPAASAALASAPVASAPGAAAAGQDRPRHYVANVGAAVGEVTALGYTLLDTGPDPASINALPAGVQALVWLGDLGNADCAPPRYPFAEVTAAVDRLAGNPKVYGYYLADEPHPRACPGAVSEIRQRADYIRAHDPSHTSFIVVLDGTNQCGGAYGCELAALAPANTHVDLVGLDPYPCSTTGGCSLSKIDDMVRRAAANGVPASAVVPVIQAFGQTCASGSSRYYRLPTGDEMRGILAHWARAVPRPAFDYAYTWGRQGSACPALVDADGHNGYPDLQSILGAHNRS